MKKLIFISLLSMLLTACSVGVGGGFNIGTGGARVNIGTGIGF